MPSSLLHSVSTNPLTKHLSGHKQHDAHEFLVAFLNAIIEVEEKEKGNRAQSEVEKLFQGKMQSKLTCGYCSLLIGVGNIHKHFLAHVDNVGNEHVHERK